MIGFTCKLSNDSTILEYYHGCEGLLKIKLDFSSFTSVTSRETNSAMLHRK